MISSVSMIRNGSLVVRAVGRTRLTPGSLAEYTLAVG